MAKAPWLSIIGFGEDGIEGLSAASRDALNSAEVVMAPPRHLSLLPDGDWDRVEWPVPFVDGVAQLKTLRGRAVAVLASGDPFWFGAGSVLAREFDEGEWQAFPAPSIFSHIAAQLGWPLEKVACLGLHAAPLSRLRPHLAPGARMIVTVRDGAAVSALARYLQDAGFGGSKLSVCEAVGGPRERVSPMSVAEAMKGGFTHPVAIGIGVLGDGDVIPRASGIPDAFFDHDGQITKRPIRAMTLSALAPRHGEHLWDIGGGSGSISIEWLLSHPSLSATAVEVDAARAARIGHNAAQLGADRLAVVHGAAPDALAHLQPPDAVFVGGGLSEELMDTLLNLPDGTRLVVNAVTLESEALVVAKHARKGGSLMRIEVSEAAPIGGKTGWRANFPIVQWSVTL